MPDSPNPLDTSPRADLDELLRGTRAVMWVRSGAEWRFDFVAGDVQAVFGYPAERLAGEPAFWQSIVHPRDRTMVLSRLREAAKTGSETTLQYRVVRPEGEEAWVQEAVAVRAGDQSRLVGTTMLAESPRRAEPREEDAYRQIVEACPKAIAVHGDGELLFVNDAAATLVGVAEARTLIGRTIREFLVPPEREEILARTALVQEGRREVHGSEEHFRRDDGRIIDVEVTSVPYRFQGRPAVLTIFSDITERKRGEEARELFAAAFRASRDPIVLFRFADEAVVDVNTAWERATGVSRAEAIGQNERALGVWASASRRDEFVQRIAELGMVRDFELMFRKRGSGEPRPAVVSAERVDLSGVAHVVVVGRDLSEQRRMEQRQRESQKTEVLGRIAGGIAHDFNNILAVIRSYAQLLEVHLSPEHELRSDVGEIAHAVERGTLLTRQLLLFSRRDAPHRQRLDLNDVVEHMQRLLTRVFPNTIAIQRERLSGAEWVHADRGQLEQALMNLAVNARDAMPEGGTLTLATAHREVTSAFARTHGLPIAPGPYAVLAVADTGTGMDANARAHLFEPFFTTKPAGEGTGLGLSTVHAVVQQHGGAVVVESEEGRGTRVEIYLPEG